MDEYSNLSDTHFQAVVEMWDQSQERSTCSITGNCMFPLIRDGNTLVIEHSKKRICLGDILVYGSPRKSRVRRLIHREIREGEIFHVLKSDRYADVHENVPSEEILGRVIEVRGSNGNFYFNSFFWRCVNPILVFLFYAAWRCRKTNSSYWKGVKSLLAIRKRIYPVRRSFRLIFLRLVCLINKMWYQVRSSSLKNI